MKLRHLVEYLGLATVAWVWRRLPREPALVVGATLGEIGWLLRLRRRLVLANIARALPECSRAQLVRIGARAARNFGRSVAEIVRAAERDRDRLAALVDFDGLEALRREVQPGRGAIVVTPHLGPWGLYLAALSMSGIPSALLAGRQHNPRVDRFIREIPGPLARLIPKGRAAPRDVLVALREGRTVMMVADQDAGRNGAMVPFLGHPASTLPLPAALATRRGTPIFSLAGHRIQGGRHHVSLTRLADDGEGDEETRRYRLALAMNDAFGAAVRAHPDQYFWYHRRWRDYASLDRESPPR